MISTLFGASGLFRLYVDRSVPPNEHGLKIFQTHLRKLLVCILFWHQACFHPWFAPINEEVQISWLCCDSQDLDRRHILAVASFLQFIASFWQHQVTRWFVLAWLFYHYLALFTFPSAHPFSVSTDEGLKLLQRHVSTGTASAPFTLLRDPFCIFPLSLPSQLLPQASPTKPVGFHWSF